MANPKLARVAVEAVYRGSEYPTKKSNCQAFVRECVEAAHGGDVSEKIRAGSARLSAQLWRSLGWGFSASELSSQGGLQEGDVLYKTEGSGGYGHAGIAVRREGRWQVAENSSTPVGRVRGALGFRTLSQFGAFQFIGRLPRSITTTGSNDLASTGAASGDTRPKPQLILAVKEGEAIEYFRLQSAELREGRFYADSAEIRTVLDGGNERVEARAFLEEIGARLYREGNHLSDPDAPRVYLFVDAT